ncbi:hypothetical protein LX64_01934 [Chitinophaga skermanii]|uniref:Lipoprotein n=1 Tax=Chitinophaga skermanii TaxID=331697 RepID=A0A327QYS4_9BACT|nr:hypothetical protein [Chitinophaga skermanii]RAJ06807.1 hypothetical protein LX64_01934 [Chitinophaga skermanii]
MKYSLFSLVMLIALTGCLKNKIAITADYIINPNWDEYENSITIQKVKVRKDSTLNPFLKLSQNEILERLEVDTSFCFTGSVKFNGEQYSKRKVYFNKKNNFYWWSENRKKKKETIGNLEKNTWYQFSGLISYPNYLYIYIDSMNQPHRFDVNQSNY